MIDYNSEFPDLTPNPWPKLSELLFKSVAGKQILIDNKEQVLLIQTPNCICAYAYLDFNGSTYRYIIQNALVEEILKFTEEIKQNYLKKYEGSFEINMFLNFRLYEIHPEYLKKLSNDIKYYFFREAKMKYEEQNFNLSLKTSTASQNRFGVKNNKYSDDDYENDVMRSLENGYGDCFGFD